MRTALYKVITLNPDAVTIEMLLFVGGVTEEGQEKGGGRASEGAELGGHREGRDRGEGVSEREVQRPLDAETSLPTAQPPQMAHPRCNSP